jgi:hypothetical protein
MPLRGKQTGVSINYLSLLGKFAKKGVIQGETINFDVGSFCIQFDTLDTLGEYGKLNCQIASSFYRQPESSGCCHHAAGQARCCTNRDR